MGVVGFEDCNDYAAIGSVTNLAARLCTEARDGQILVPERFLQSVSELVDSEPVGDMLLKGFRKPVAVHTITGMRE